MKIFFIRLFLTFLVQFFLYQKTTLCLGVAIFIFVIGCVLSYQKIYQGTRDKILSLLADKIFFSSTLIVLTDLEILSAILVAWIIGVVFIHSGIDLLERSLHVGFQDLNFSWFSNLVHMGLVLVVLIIFSLQGQISTETYRGMFCWISYMWVLLTIVLLIKALFSERFRRLIKEA